jgi:hypothetical protein
MKTLNSKKVYLKKVYLLAVSMAVLSTNCFADGKPVEVSSVKIISSRQCGIVGPPGHQAPCFTSTVVSFVAATNNSCQIFAAAEQTSEDNSGTMITITLTSQPNCSAVDGPTVTQTHQVVLPSSGGNSQGPYFISNPIAVNASTTD